MSDEIKGSGDVDCLLKLAVTVDNEGELTGDQLDQLDEELSATGSERTGQRVDVTSTQFSNSARVEYVYQERLNHWSIDNLIERIEVRTEFDDPSVFIDTQMVRYE